MKEAMSLNSKLTEGLRVGDLADCVSPKISIDEYESKIDDEAIVVGFYVIDRPPAEDLSAFIETSGMDAVIDTEISPATDENDNYVIFVEYVRDEKFPNDLMMTIDSLKMLTKLSPKEWTFTCYGSHGKEEPLTDEAIRSSVRLEKQEETDEDVKESDMEFTEFFRESDLDDVYMKDQKIILEKYTTRFEFEVRGFGIPNKLMESESLVGKALRFDSESLRQCSNIRRILGENWEVTMIEDAIVVANSYDKRIMVLS